MTSSEQLPPESAVGTVRLASEFLEAARAQDLDRSPPSMVTYFLLGHALELAFKSLLIVHGTSDKSLRRIRHNLATAAKAASEVSPPGVIELSESDVARLGLLGPYYQVKAFEYLMTGARSLPVPRELLELTARIVGSVERFVDGSGALVVTQQILKPLLRPSAHPQPPPCAHRPAS